MQQIFFFMSLQNMLDNEKYNYERYKIMLWTKLTHINVS